MNSFPQPLPAPGQNGAGIKPMLNNVVKAPPVKTMPITPRGVPKQIKISHPGEIIKVPANQATHQIVRKKSLSRKLFGKKVTKGLNKVAKFAIKQAGSELGAVAGGAILPGLGSRVGRAAGRRAGNAVVDKLFKKKKSY